MKRIVSAAATRRALLDHAAALLDEGGPAAVTLRAVGAAAGVTRGAPYGHFADKDALLEAIAAEGWNRLSTQLHALSTRLGDAAPEDRLREALSAMTDLSRRQPHLYRLMFNPAAGRMVPDAAEQVCEQFLPLVAAVTGDDSAARYAAILLTAAHGAAGLEASGLLQTEKWQTSAGELLDALLATVPRVQQHT